MTSQTNQPRLMKINKQAVLRALLGVLKHPITIFTLILCISLGGILLVSWAILSIPTQDMQRQLIYVMIFMGIVTTLTSYCIYRIRLLEWLKSLRWTLLLIISFTVAVVLLNVWVLARLMFIDSHYLWMTSTMLSFAGMTAASFGFFVSKTMIDRLQELTEASSQLAQGDLTTRLNVKGNDEIAKLTHSFNEMAQSLEEVDDQKRMLEKTRRDLVAWVSHDLRTPLASMRVMLEAIADGVISDQETQQRYVHSSLAEISHLSHLIEDLFEMARLDVGHVELTVYETDLRDLISDTIGSMNAKAANKNIILEGYVAEDVRLVKIAPDKIQRVLHNLVNNAIQYTPNNEHVTIRAYRNKNNIQIDIFNSGVYIPDDVLPNIFESFYRGERSRATNESGERGTGLGLAIARGFIEAHHGKIWATSKQGTGTTFSFTLPVN